MLCNKLQCVWEMADIALSDKVCLGHRNLSSTTALRSTCTRVRMLALQDEVPLKGAEVWRTIPSQKWQWVYPLIRHLLHVPPCFSHQPRGISASLLKLQWPLTSCACGFHRLISKNWMCIIK